MSSIIFDISAKSFGAALRRLREEKLGWTQLQLAQYIGGKARERYVQRWEKGHAMPDGYTTLKILKLCPDAESLAEFGIILVAQGDEKLAPQAALDEKHEDLIADGSIRRKRRTPRP